MPMRRENNRERKEQFQTFSRPKVKIARTSAGGKVYIDYKDTESLRKLVSGNGKILWRQRDGAANDRPRREARPLYGAAAVRQRSGLNFAFDLKQLNRPALPKVKP